MLHGAMPLPRDPRAAASLGLDLAPETASAPPGNTPIPPYANIKT